MRAVVVVACLLAVVAALPSLREEEYQFLFSKWVTQHNKVYTKDAFFARYRIWKKNMDHIRHHNSVNSTWTAAANKFTDLTKAEFVEQFTGLLAPKTRPTLGHEQQRPTGHAVAIDWVAKGDVVHVKDQGQCGSCWAFSAIGGIESAWKLAGHPLTSLSEQQLVDCSTAYGNQGCNGGWMDNAFNYVQAHGGIATETAYPYHARDGTCKNIASAAHITGHVDVAHSAAALEAALKMRPVSVAVDAANWQSYSGGIFSDCGEQLDHGVLLVGEDAGGNWRIKNSWGTGWGESGFIRLAAGCTCGICSAASYPTA